jgi:CHASE1-domain containing sensor protein
MNEMVATIIAAITSAIVGGFVGSLITIAKFGSKIDSQAMALQAFVTQRAEDRSNELRENERIRQEFREFCSSQNQQRERELEYIRREFRDFRNVADRRQRYIMDMVTAIAAKAGITHRITDQLTTGEDE